MKYDWLIAAGAVALASAGGAARAAPELGDVVYAPYVEDGESSVEIRGGRSLGGSADTNAGEIVEIERGVNSWFSAALVGEFEQHPHEVGKLDSVGVETVFSTGTIPVIDVDTGLYLEYQQRLHAESGIGEVKALFAKRVGDFEGRLNINMFHPFTTRELTEYDYAASADWGLSRDARLGVEALGELGFGGRFGGGLQHYVGPLFKYTINGLPYVGVKLQTAYLFAVGDPAHRTDDGQIRVGLELEKRF